MKHKTSRNRQRQVECASEHFLRSINCVNTVRAVKTRFQRQDLFACDCIGKVKGTGYFIGIQVTCGDHRDVGHRRRKLEQVAWASTDRVLLGEYRNQRNGPRMMHWFRMHEFHHGTGLWRVWDEPVTFDSRWFKAWKPQSVADEHRDETATQRSAG